MNKIYFLTGNQGKTREIKKQIPEIEQLNIDLDEIQETDAKKIIEHKIREAIKKAPGKKLIVEDTSLYLECLNELPGPLIKWFLKKLGTEGISEITTKLGNNKAEAKTIIGYYDSEKITFFEGTTKGTITQPKGNNGFGWDQIFKPENSEKTFAEMTLEEKEKHSMRQKAIEKLKKHLEKERNKKQQ